MSADLLGTDTVSVPIATRPTPRIDAELGEAFTAALIPAERPTFTDKHYRGLVWATAAMAILASAVGTYGLVVVLGGGG